MRFLKWFGIIVLILIVVYFLGPHPSKPVYELTLPAVPADPGSLETFIKQGESAHKLKPDNEARIIWASDSNHQKTEYSVVYLHGFSASQEEGDPVHTRFAQEFGCNLYLSRLAEHGIDTTEPMVNLTADKLWNSAREAYAIGKQLGKKVILLSTSAGSTLALKLAAEFPEIAGVIMLSPCVAINDPNAWLLNNPWGLQVAHMVKGPYNISEDTSKLYRQYWTYRYRMEAVVQLEELLETSMKASLFERVKQPVLMVYYYKDEEHQDDVVKVSAMDKMYRHLGTPENLKMKVVVPNAGAHVIGSYIKSKDLKSVEDACEKFGTDILHLPKVNEPS
jgi:esterase/lipase